MLLVKEVLFGEIQVVPWIVYGWSRVEGHLEKND